MNGEQRREQSYHVTVTPKRAGTTEVTFTVPPASPEGGDVPLNPSWQYLSPLGVRVLRLLAGTGWLAKDEIAAQIGENPEGDLRPILSDLVKRCFIESSSRKGYSLNLPENVKPEEFRTKLLAWLDTQPKECE